jgi:pimeloyl-ACP methyl ester carboxylesterase
VESIDEMRDAVGLIAGTLCLGRSILVGHSMGGVIALSAALAWPDKVAALVLVASSARIMPSAPFLSILEHEWARWPVFLEEGGYSPETPRERRRRSASIACAAEQAQTRRDYAALAATDLRGRLGDVAVPTLVVSGAHDLMVPAKHGAATAAAIPGARHVVIPRCGHFPMHEAPEELVDAIVRLIS